VNSSVCLPTKILALLYQVMWLSDGERAERAGALGVHVALQISV
jgi:hypothetical protein